MANQKPVFLPDDVCPCLRTKTMTLNTEYRRSAFEDSFTADTAIFTCLKTQCSHGPDELDCSAEMCRPGRECYEPPDDIT